MRTLPIILATLALSALTLAAPPTPESIGSLDGARVAIPIDAANRGRLTYIAYGLEDDQLAQLRADSPNLDLIHVDSRADALQHAARAHGADARLVTPDFLAAAANLRWVQSTSAGVDRLLEIPALAASERIVLTNMRAVHGPAIADHAFAMLLTLTRDMRRHESNQRDAQWQRSDEGEAIALEGRTMFVVGLGGIGTEIARRADGFGMRVIASRRSGAPGPEFVDETRTPDHLLDMLAEADVVAIATPLTDETRGLFDQRAFDAMKPGAYLINIARGAIVDTDALIAALDSGKLAGACLDVTHPEPLPDGHPLWSYDNVVITPHIAARAELTSDRWWTIYRDNVRRFAAGEPLLNTVDMAAGY